MVITLLAYTGHSAMRDKENYYDSDTTTIMPI